MSTAVILGAGFSFAAGFPMTKDLFVGDLPISKPGRDRQLMATVQSAFEGWKSKNPSLGPEQWLKVAYDSRDAETGSEGARWPDMSGVERGCR